MSTNANAVFSVVTPVRNGLPYIQRCVASVRSQGAVQREHIVQDAVSNDGTAEWCFSQSDLAVRSERDAGMYDAINRGWDRASGRYFSWLNADEQYLPGTMDLVAMEFENTPHIDAIFGDAIIVGANGEPLAYRREPALRASYVRNSFLYVYSCTLFYRRRLWEDELLRLDSSLRYAADMDLVLRLLSRKIKFGRIRQPLALYAATGSNLSTHEGMQTETRLLYERYGGFRSRLMRGLARVPRWIERLLIGGFSRRTGSYAYCPDAVSAQKIIEYKNLGTRYSVFLSDK